MADGTGLSIGSTRLAAVVVDRTAVTRAPVLTLYPHRPPEVGVPSENSHLTEPGLILTDFVDRVGDPVAIVGADGTTHRAEALLVESLRALVRTVVAGRPAGPVAVSHPAHWQPAAVDVVRAVLADSAEFPGTDGPVLIADALAALTALSRDPGVPTEGVIAVCDFGGTGTSLTLVDRAGGAEMASLAPTVRHPDLSGGLIDQALLKHVLNGVSEAGSIDLSGTSAIGSLSRLRAQCRTAKEQLSTTAVTSLTAELPGRRTDLRITRDELDETLRVPLQEFIELIQEELERNGIRTGDLAAMVSIGGGARIPAVTTGLSEHFQVPVITTGYPELTAAIGAGLQAVRSTVQEKMTTVAPVAAPAAEAPESPAAGPISSNFGALAWSDADDVPDVAPADPSDYDNPSGPDDLSEYDVSAEARAPEAPRPILQFTANSDLSDGGSPPVLPWYRRPPVLAGIAIAGGFVVLGSAAIMVMRDDGSPAPTTTPGTSTSAPTPASTAPVSTEPPPTVQPPPPATVEQAPAPPETQAPQPAPTPTPQPSPTQAPPPTQEPQPTPEPSPTEVPPPTQEPSPTDVPPPTSEQPPQEPPPTQEPPTTEAPAPIEGPVITIPGLPPIPLFPQPGQPVP